MRDTCKGSDSESFYSGGGQNTHYRQVLRLLRGSSRHSRNTAEFSLEGDTGNVGLPESPDPPTSAAPLPSLESRTPYTDNWIMLFPPPSLTANVPPAVHLSTETFVGRPMILSLSPISSSLTPRLGGMSPAVSLMSPYPLRLECRFFVYMDTEEAPIYEEEGLLTRDSRAMPGSSAYATALVPGYWRTICSDPSQSYLISMQRLLLNTCSAPSNFLVVQRVRSFDEYRPEVALHYRFSNRFDATISPIASEYSVPGVSYT